MHGGSVLIVPILMVVWGMGLVTFIAVRGLGWRHREKEIAARQAEQQIVLQQSGPTLDQVQMLEDRVRVLERIVTDQSHGLAHDIEALRDTPQRKELNEGSKL
jgi:hypothetical protein